MLPKYLRVIIHAWLVNLMIPSLCEEYFRHIFCTMPGLPDIHHQSRNRFFAHCSGQKYHSKYNNIGYWEFIFGRPSRHSMLVNSILITNKSCYIHTYMGNRTSGDLADSYCVGTSGMLFNSIVYHLLSSLSLSLIYTSLQNYCTVKG
jgi:hypothetical protein